MQFYVVAPLIVVGITSVLSKKSAAVLTAILVGWSALLLASGVSYETARLDLFVGFFLIGGIASLTEWRPSRRSVVSGVAGLSALWLALLIFPQTRGLIWIRGATQRQALAGESLIWIPMVLLGVPMALSTVYLHSPKWDRWLGDLSYPLYLFHWLPRDWYYAHVDWSQPVWWNAGLLGINLMVAVIGAAFIVVFVDHPIQRWRTSWNTVALLKSRPKLSVKDHM